MRSLETQMVFQFDPWFLLGGIAHHKHWPQNMCYTHSWPHRRWQHHQQDVELWERQWSIRKDHLLPLATWMGKQWSCQQNHLMWGGQVSEKISIPYQSFSPHWEKREPNMALLESNFENWLSIVEESHFFLHNHVWGKKLYLWKENHFPKRLREPLSKKRSKTAFFFFKRAPF